MRLRHGSGIDVGRCAFESCTTHMKADRSDDPTEVEHAPVSLQLIGRKLEEEKVLALLEIVDAAVKSYPAR